MEQNGVLFFVVTFMLTMKDLTQAEQGKVGVEVDAAWVSKYSF